MRAEELADGSIGAAEVRLRLGHDAPTVADALDMQRAVRTIYLAKKRPSPASGRACLRAHADAGGRVVVKGIVCDARWHQGGAKDGLVSRFCLLFPAVLGARGEWECFDTHMWLKPTSLDMTCAGEPYRLPSGDALMCRVPDNGFLGLPFTVCLGDTLVVSGHVAAYTKHARGRTDTVESFGFDSWCPVAGGFLLYEDGYGQTHAVARRLMARESLVMGVSAASHVVVAKRDGLALMKRVLDEGAP